MTLALCLHPQTRVLAAFGSTLDDHDLYYLHCPCGAYIARTDWRTDRGVEEVPMTADEIARFGAVADGPAFDGDDLDVEWD